MMSTNFYWLFEPPVLPTGEIAPVDTDSPVVHIGKRYGAGCGKLGFILAQPLKDIMAVYDYLPDEWVAYDEYGVKYTGAQLKEVLRVCDPMLDHSIGQRFS